MIALLSERIEIQHVRQIELVALAGAEIRDDIDIAPRAVLAARLPVISHLSCPCPAARGCGLPAADRAGQPLARGVRAHPVLGSAEKAV